MLFLLSILKNEGPLPDPIYLKFTAKDPDNDDEEAKQVTEETK